ncbi:hypothetical protein D2E26_0155 [Bifidobacterium dolichotidis]|uniref:Tmp1 n=1 Tax=Bifidobacterium dolichotidis TaxID=2306976 RepID=A0A430FRT3_9BIFI|nr:DUF4391 domain-containing protein [Bifidobacterium dolichotidis]RSX55592.1 hypothetical protein D2E26_0155 [Bifidobacterium dolichotidis]
MNDSTAEPEAASSAPEASSTTPSALSACGSLTAVDLGLPHSVAVPAAKGRLPKAMFAGHDPAALSNTVRQQLTQQVESIHLLGIISAKSVHAEPSAHVPEVLVLRLQLAQDTQHFPDAVIELIATQRKGGILFVCTREVTEPQPHAPEPGTYVAYAVRRGFSARAGHMQTFERFHSPWKPVSEPQQLRVVGDSVAQIWDNLCAQIMLHKTTTENLSEDLKLFRQKAALRRDLAKLTADHARAKTIEKRNELFARKAQIQRALDQLEQMEHQSE